MAGPPRPPLNASSSRQKRNRRDNRTTYTHTHTLGSSQADQIERPGPGAPAPSGPPPRRGARCSRKTRAPSGCCGPPAHTIVHRSTAPPLTTPRKLHAQAGRGTVATDTGGGELRGAPVDSARSLGASTTAQCLLCGVRRGCGAGRSPSGRCHWQPSVASPAFVRPIRKGPVAHDDEQRLSHHKCYDAA
jgi:hypothetical protein